MAAPAVLHSEQITLNVLSRVILSQFPPEARPDPICSPALRLSIPRVLMSQVTWKQHGRSIDSALGRREQRQRKRRGQISTNFYWSLLNSFLKEDLEVAKQRRGVWGSVYTKHLTLPQVSRAIWKWSDYLKPWELLTGLGLSIYLNL